MGNHKDTLSIWGVRIPTKDTCRPPDVRELTDVQRMARSSPFRASAPKKGQKGTTGGSSKQTGRPFGGDLPRNAFKAKVAKRPRKLIQNVGVVGVHVNLREVDTLSHQHGTQSPY